MECEGKNNCCSLAASLFTHPSKVESDVVHLNKHLFKFLPLLFVRTRLLQMQAWVPTSICQVKLNVMQVSWMENHFITVPSGPSVVSYFLSSVVYATALYLGC